MICSSEGDVVTSSHTFSLLTNHTHVLVLIAQKPDIRMREIATTIGITERAVQRIVDDLTSTGYIAVTKDGRRNRYEIQPNSSLRHPLAKHRTVGELIRFLYPYFSYESYGEAALANSSR
jgi:predicted transcriptional regulator